MNPIEITGLALAVFVFAIAASILGRRLDAVGCWAWAWTVLIAAGLLLESGADWPAARATGAFLAVLFPGLQLAGAFEYLDRRVPRWLLPGFLVIAATRVAVGAVGYAAQSHLAVVGFELWALLAAASMIYRSGAGHALEPKGWLLIVGFMMCAFLEATDAVLDLGIATGAGVSWTVWLGIGIPIGGSQIVLTFDHLQHRLAKSLFERERALEALEESNERFRAIAEHAHDLIVESNASSGIRYVNPQFCATLGYTPEEVLGRHIADFAWDKNDFPSRSDLVGKREFFFPRARIRHRDGTPRWIESSARTYLRDREAHIVLIARDVTERRLADERLRKAQKLESLGLMAGGIAHDFNNLLTGILGNADLALLHLEADQPAREFVEQVIASSELAAELTRQIQAYSGSSPFEVRSMDVSKEIRRRSELLHTAVGDRLTLEFDLADGLPAVEADPTVFAQVLMNLILNAAEACGEGPGLIRVATGRIRIGGQAPVPVTGSLEDGEYVFVEVADTGHGVDDSIRDRLFDPFFTTKETGRGLGLSVVHGVVTMLRGAMTIDSTPEKGALFRLFLPTTQQVIIDESSPRPTLLGRDGILVLDDNVTVLAVVREALERYGYRVFIAENGTQAEQLMAEHGAQIAMVLLDAVLQGELSEQVLDRLQRLRPNVPVLLMSGYDQVEAMTRFAEGRHIAGFLSKPFSSESLVSRVRATLDSVSPAPDR